MPPQSAASATQLPSSRAPAMHAAQASSDMQAACWGLHESDPPPPPPPSVGAEVGLDDGEKVMIWPPKPPPPPELKGGSCVGTAPPPAPSRSVACPDVFIYLFLSSLVIRNSVKMCFVLSQVCQLSSGCRWGMAASCEFVPGTVVVKGETAV